VLILHLHSFLPIAKGKLISTTCQRHYGLLVADIGSLTYHGELHLVKGSHEELLVIFYQKLLDVCKLTLALCDRIYVDAFYKYLDERSTLWEFSPSKGQTVK
jgi:hypothetical protein